MEIKLLVRDDDNLLQSRVDRLLDALTGVTYVVGARAPGHLRSYRLRWVTFVPASEETAVELVRRWHRYGQRDPVAGDRRG